MATEAGASSESTTETLTLLDRIIAEGRMAHDESQQDYARDMLAEFATQVLDEGMSIDKDTVAMINDRISQIDKLISDQLNEVLHHPDLQKLEASWRGLHMLVDQTETSTRLKLRLLNVTQKELQNDLEKAVEFDQSALFKKIYEEEYGTFGGHPFSLLVGDYAFGRHPQDVALLEKLSNVAAAAHAPFIAAANPKLFDMNSFTELAVPRDLSKIFESLELIKWRSFRESEDSRYVSLVLPNFLLRLPYGPDTKPVEGIGYVEDVNGTDHSKYLWGNAAWLMAVRITTAFAKYGWCAAIRGAEGGGAVEDLPAHTFRTLSGDLSLKCPTEVAITDRREKELNDLGFITLCHKKNTDMAVFFGGQTTNKAKVYNTNEANANARISAMLPYVLAASRFAHYLKVIMRDKVGSFMTRDNVQTYLNNWIADYVLINDNAPQEIKAQYPTPPPAVPTGARPHHDPLCFQTQELSAMDAIILDLGDDIKGDSLLEGYTDKIELMSYSHNVAMQVTNDVSNSERTSGKPHIGEFTVTKFVDTSTPSLNEYCCAGKPITKATITIGRNASESDGKLLSFIVYTLDNVVLSNVSVSGGAGGKPVETLSMNFTKIKWELTAQKDDGTKEGTAASTWDLAANKLVK